MLKSKRTSLLLSFAFFVLLLVGFGALGVWAYVGQIEESVPGQGEMLPESEYRVLRAPVGGVVVASYIKENQRVKKGQILFKLDPSKTQVEGSRSSEELALLKSQALAMKAALAQTQAATSNATSQAWLAASRASHEAKMNQAIASISRNEHLIEESLAEQSKLASLLASHQSMIGNYRELFAMGGIAKQELLQHENKLTELQGEANKVAQEIEARKMALAQAQQSLAELEGTYDQLVLERLGETEKQVVMASADVQRVKVDTKLQVIVSPIDGVVHQQLIKGTGDVVAAGDNLVKLVPHNTQLLAEVKIPNRELSYIHPGQQAALRLDAYPYQTFGRLIGTVETISPSTVQEPDQPPMYVVRIRPKVQYISHSGQQLPLRSGMTLTTDIVTRRKPVVAFLTEPLGFKLDKALRDPTTR